jgi:hypothetical protein
MTKRLFMRLVPLFVMPALLYGCLRRIGHPPDAVNYPAERLVGSWIGLTEQDSSYYLLKLRPDGGVLYSQSWDGTMVTNSIGKWSIQGCDLRCAFAPPPSRSYAVVLECEIWEDHLIGRLSGVQGWHDSVVFRRQRLLESALQRFNELDP